MLVDGGMRPRTQEIYLEPLTSSSHLSGRLVLHGLAVREADSTALDHDQGQPTRSLQPAVRCRALPQRADALLVEAPVTKRGFVCCAILLDGSCPAEPRPGPFRQEVMLIALPPTTIQ